MYIRHRHTGKGGRLDVILSRKAPDFSREDIKRAIREGFVTVNSDVVTKPGRTISDGEFVEMNLMRFKKSFYQNAAGYQSDIEQITQQIDIIAEYPDFLVVNKPAGLLVHQTHNPHDISLVDILTKWYPEMHGVGESFTEQNRSGIVHRIDKDTSGLLVVARTEHGYRNLKQQFKNRTVKKEYMAIVRGTLSSAFGQITYNVARSKTDHTRRTVVTEETPKRQYSGTPRKAHTEYEVVAYGTWHTIPVTNVRVWLHTGRTHQIRLHFKAIGHPLLGDKMYGGKWEKYESPAVRQLLHASRLAFTYNGETYDFSVDIPEEMKIVGSG